MTNRHPEELICVSFSDEKDGIIHRNLPRIRPPNPEESFCRRVGGHYDSTLVIEPGRASSGVWMRRRARSGESESRPSVASLPASVAPGMRLSCQRRTPFRPPKLTPLTRQIPVHPDTTPQSLDRPRHAGGFVIANDGGLLPPVTTGSRDVARPTGRTGRGYSSPESP